MKVKQSGQAMRELQNVPKFDRPRLFSALEILQYDDRPAGIIEGLDVDSRPIDILSIYWPRPYRLKLNNPKSDYRIIYFPDKVHNVVYVITVRHRSRAYPISIKDIKTMEDVIKYIKDVIKLRSEIKVIMDDYRQNRRWEDGC